jgi:HD-like signal output (HDOD) protein
MDQHGEMFAELESAAERMPAVSPIVGKISRMARELDASPKELIKIIMLEPVLTGKVIRLVNSTFYALAQPVQSLAHAVVLLGMNTVKNLAVSTAVLSAVFQEYDEGPISHIEFWRHSLGTAVGCRLLAERLKVPTRERETYFVAGLLHDIGKILLLRLNAQCSHAAVRESRACGVSLSFAEAAHFGCTHAEAGGLLARRWKLDAVLTHAVAEHHNPRSTPTASTKLTPTTAVWIANNLCKRFHIGDGGNPVIEETATALAESAGATTGIVNEIAAQLPTELDKATEFLQLVRQTEAP